MKKDESFILKMKFRDEAGYCTVIKEFYNFNEAQSFLDKEWRIFKGRLIQIMDVPDPLKSNRINHA
jgi:hypothetical protein